MPKTMKSKSKLKTKRKKTIRRTKSIRRRRRRNKKGGALGFSLDVNRIIQSIQECEPISVRVKSPYFGTTTKYLIDYEHYKKCKPVDEQNQKEPPKCPCLIKATTPRFNRTTIYELEYPKKIQNVSKAATWSEHKDPKTGNVYYINADTGERSWEKPTNNK